MVSGSETALFSLTAMDLHRIRVRGGAVGRTIVALQNQLPDLLMTLLLCNMIVNILIFATATVIGSTLSPGADVTFGITSLLLVIICGEVVPKLVATVARVPFCRLTVLPLFALHRLTSPLRYFLGGIVGNLERMFRLDKTGTFIKSEELNLLVRLSHEEGSISTSEHDLIREVLELPEIRVREIMTPRVDVTSVLPNTSAEDILAEARAAGHSKIPVRDPNTDEFTGWLNAREILLADADTPWQRREHQARVVSELDRADQVLAMFRESAVPLAIVVDERGGTAGIITPTDIVEEIFGELPDEDEQNEEPIREDGENAYILAGNVSVRDWRDTFGVLRKLPPVTTVGGLVSALLGHTPQFGDTVSFGNMRLEVTRIHKRRVQEIRLTLLDSPPLSPEGKR